MALHVMDEANQCLGCKKPCCQQGCPIQTNIPEVIRLLKANKLDEAGRKAGIVRCYLKTAPYRARYHVYQTEKRPVEQPALWPPQRNAANA